MAQRCDFLVLGSGIAGLSYALDAAEHGTVCVVTKRRGDDSNTNFAQGGIAAVMGDDDSFAEHVDNTMTAGDGLNKRDVVALCVREGPDAIRRLVARGVQFAEDLSQEGGHTKRRVLHTTATDITGQEIQKQLLARARAHENIEILEAHCAIDLIRRCKLVSDDRPDRILGAYVLDVSAGRVKTIVGKVVVLATGGSGKVYLYTSNPDVATGDGLAMAFRARARIANMEFFQFHPTCLYHPAAKSFLISEALRGEGAILRRIDGTPFMDAVHPMGSLAPRDIVARAIDAEMKRTGDSHVVLDLSHLDPDHMEERFPTILGRCRELGIDFRKGPLPVVPAAHYQCGGVVTDPDGRTSVAGLYAIGEVSCTGLHGANRLASNSLLEGAVFGRRAALASIAEITGADASDDDPEPVEWDSGHAVKSTEDVVVAHSWDEIRRLMWNYVGIVRSNKRLLRARRRLMLIRSEILEDWWKYYVTRHSIELRNIATVADLIVESALRRPESRGLHFSEDYPHRDEDRGMRDTELWLGDR